MSVVISGGGLVGATLAIAIAQQNISVTVVDPQSWDMMLDPRLDGRTTAVSYGSKVIFDDIGVWAYAQQGAEPIWHIRVHEEGSPWQVSYDAKTIGSNPMGYIADNLTLRKALLTRVQELPQITWCQDAIVSHQVDGPQQHIQLRSGKELTAQLLVSSEGKHSPLRRQNGIQQTSWDYPHWAFVCTVRHATPHEGAAWEVFMPEGPLALLPLSNCPETGLYRSGVVLSWSKEKSDELMAADREAVSQFLSEKFRHYGPLEWVGERWTYPLMAMKLDRLIDHRFALVGDAAHVVHPVAGQGVNLGWRDAAFLAKLLGEAFQVGQDLGSYTLLQQYERLRQRDHRQMLQMTDGVIQLFGHPSKTLYHLRTMGLGAVERLWPVKRFLMRRAMGIDQDQLPRLNRAVA